MVPELWFFWHVWKIMDRQSVVGCVGEPSQVGKLPTWNFGSQRKWKKLKDERNSRKMKKDWGNVPILPIREWEAGYSPVLMFQFWHRSWFKLVTVKSIGFHTSLATDCIRALKAHSHNSLRAIFVKTWTSAGPGSFDGSLKTLYKSQAGKV